MLITISRTLATLGLSGKSKGRFLMQEERRFVGMLLFMEAGQKVKIEYCFDITDELPPSNTRIRKDSLWLGLVHRKPDDFGVQIIFSEQCLGIYRDLSELKTNKFNSSSDMPVFNHAFRNQLELYGLTPEKYTGIAERAAAYIIRR